MRSSSGTDLRSPRKFPIRGKVSGPGGMLDLEEEAEKRPRRDLIKAATQRVTTIMNQTSIGAEK